jgi:cobalt/nickel transport system permease protein
MHLADGTLSNQICTLTALTSAAAVSYAVVRVRPWLNRANLTRAAIGAALVFGAQMVDVPLFGGVGVHLIGAALLVTLAGPPLALLAMALIIATQALFLADGGVAAMGANVMNMGVVAVGAAWVFMRATRASVGGRAGVMAGVALASAASVFAAVAAMAIELSLSGVPAGEAFALTMTAHAPFAAWETALTLGLVAIALQVRATGLVTERAAERE